VERFNVDRFAVFFDRLNDGINVAANFLFVAVFGDANTLIIVVGFVDGREARREFGDKGDVRGDKTSSDV